MSIQGNNLLAQYYAQNQGYAKTPSLWIEADSWGQSAWTNKGNGGYNLIPQSNMRGAVVGNAIVATKSLPFAATANVNVVGTGSFTVEAVVKKDANFNGSSSPYSSFLGSQRTDGEQQNNSWQVYFRRADDYRVTFGGWNNNGDSIASALYSQLYYTQDEIQYYAVGYDAGSRTLWKQLNNQIIQSSSFDFSCGINNFKLGSTGWTTAVNDSVFLGSLYSFRVYQRTLSAYERSINRAIDRRRFNF